MQDPPAMEGIRGVLVHTGLGTPPARAFVVGTVIGLGAYFLKMPSVSCDEDGRMRPFSAVSKDPNATYYHFLGVPLVAATAAFLFT